MKIHKIKVKNRETKYPIFIGSGALNLLKGQIKSTCPQTKKRTLPLTDRSGNDIDTQTCTYQKRKHMSFRMRPSESPYGPYRWRYTVRLRKTQTMKALPLQTGQLTLNRPRQGTRHKGNSRLEQRPHNKGLPPPEAPLHI